MIFIFKRKFSPQLKVYKILRSFFGIGVSTVDSLLIKLGANYNTTLYELKRFRSQQLNKYLLNNKKRLGDELRRVELDVHYKRYMIGCYKGLRLRRNLPINGQRTHTNAKTTKRIYLSSNGLNTQIARLLKYEQNRRNKRKKRDAY